MKILLTGHKGFIGSALLTQLMNRDDVEVVHCIDLQAGTDLLTCDFPHQVDLVIHLAGHSGVRESLKDPSAYLDEQRRSQP